MNEEKMVEKELKATICLVTFLVVLFLAIRIPTPTPSAVSIMISFIIFVGLVLLLPNLFLWWREDYNNKEEIKW